MNRLFAVQVTKGTPLGEEIETPIIASSLGLAVKLCIDSGCCKVDKYSTLNAVSVLRQKVDVFDSHPDLIAEFVEDQWSFNLEVLGVFI